MPARKPSTERQRRLGAELRKMREHVGLTVSDAAAIHRTDRATVCGVESGRSRVSAERVRGWAANYSCPEPGYVEALAEMAGERGANWWDEYRDLVAAGLLDLAELEHHAKALLVIEITHVPGLLQHEDHTRAVLGEAVPPLTSKDLGRRLAFRLQRRTVLDRQEPVKCTFLVHEAALRMRFGDRKAARAQLEHLLKQSERPSTTIRVLPFSSGGLPSAGCSTVYASGPVPRLATVQTGTPAGPAFLHSETHLTNYRTLLGRAEARSLQPEPSRDFIREVSRQI
jgi:transcriptional regulator with XRE-family HTH domain